MPDRAAHRARELVYALIVQVGADKSLHPGLQGHLTAALVQLDAVEALFKLGGPQGPPA